MKRRLFLYGEIGCGKSTMLRSALGEQMRSAGGFVTQRIMEADRLLGFELLPAALAASGVRGRVFLSFSETLPLDEHVFSETAVRLLAATGGRSFFVLDEIGGAELLESEFSEALYEFLKSDIPCIGVIKTRESARKLQRRVHVGAAYEKVYEELTGYLEKDADTELLPVTGWDDVEACRQVSAWAQEYAPAAGKESGGAHVGAL